jgi:hypothetical protein
MASEGMARPRNCVHSRQPGESIAESVRQREFCKMAKLSARTKKNLNMQGFENLDEATKSRYSSALRFTPGVAVILIVIGLVLRSPIWLWSMAIVALSGALLPSGMIIDSVYNFGVRHIFRAPPLPPTPKPRQFSYFLSFALLASSALSLQYHQPVLAFVLGGLVVLGATILSTTLWCLGSWLYRLAFGSASDRR